MKVEFIDKSTNTVIFNAFSSLQYSGGDTVVIHGAPYIVNSVVKVIGDDEFVSISVSRQLLTEDAVNNMSYNLLND